MATTDDLPFRAGSLCLDFANTLDRRGGARVQDRLADYPALLAWARRAGALDAPLAAWLGDCAAWAPATAAGVLARARRLRAAIYAAASARAAGRTPDEAGLAALNRELAPLLAATRLAAGAHGLTRAWAGAEDDLARPLWPLAWSAFDLLSGPRAARLRECAGDDCRRLFLDASKNASRRWCAMGGCGNLAKARRHRARAKGAGRAQGNGRAAGAEGR